MTSTSEAHPDLREYEIWWREHYNFFKANGYMLRSRYNPDWVPSWRNTEKAPEHCEDGVKLPAHRCHLLDARRARDGARVSLKRIDTSKYPHEIEITRNFGTSTLSQDRANHCVPIYEVLKVPSDNNLKILVMPLLRDATEPSFDTVGEVIDCVYQLLEGLQFMHRHHVAHRNCTQLSILMDDSVFLDAWHPIDQSMSEDLTYLARHHTRTQSPPQYYYVDFSISRKYEASDNNPLEQPLLGKDRDSVPGFKGDFAKPWSPFATDVWCLGHAIQEIFLDRYSGVKFLNGLVSDMMHADPTKRPNMDDVVSRFKDLCRSLGARKLRSRVVHADNKYFVGFIPHWVRRIQYIVHKIPPTRTPIS